MECRRGARDNVTDRVAMVFTRIVMVLIAVLSTIPAHLAARVHHAVYTVRIPRRLRVPVLKLWCWYFSADASEATQELQEYATLEAFFMRNIRVSEVRTVARTAEMVMPIDGTIVSCQMLTETEDVSEGKATAIVREGKEASARGAAKQRSHSRRSARPDGGGSASASTRKGGTAGSPDPDEDAAKEHMRRGEGIRVLEPKMSEREGYGKVPNALVLVKGVPYRIHDLMGVPPPIPPKGSAVRVMVLYLPPSEYHHFHSPVDFTITHRIRIPGHVGPTHSPWARILPQVTWSNERVALIGRWKHGFFAFVAIAASAFVAQINILGDNELQTNKPADFFGHGWKLLSGAEPPHAAFEMHERAGPGGGAYPVPTAGTPGATPTQGLHVQEYSPPRTVAKGAELGYFQVGSGLTLVFEAPVNWSVREDRVVPGKHVSLGLAISQK
jgi:phosphatidylserine decarboxylase